MRYQAELNFFIQILKSLNIAHHFAVYPYDQTPDMDLGIRRLLNPHQEYHSYLSFDSKLYPSNKIYYVTDEYDCSYIFMLLPEMEPDTYFVLGPYLTKQISTPQLYRYAERFSLPPGLVKQMEHYYQFLPVISDAGMLSSIILSFAKVLWGDVENFSFEEINNSRFPKTDLEHGLSIYEDSEFPPFSVQRIEDLYARENQFILAVSQGNFLKAEEILLQSSLHSFEQRTTETLRNEKNYSIILNTLLRKAADHGAVHPYHIDAISSKYAHKIELVSSTKEVLMLQKEMIHKYCLLVKNHSMKGYSLLVRKVLTQIETDITANLTLNALATSLNVNSSYLSTLFRKETGLTLTEFVNRKRIDHALLLLNSTNLQIQTIAQHCGISDVNYFTKLFKKQVGKTPKEYRSTFNPRKN